MKHPKYLFLVLLFGLLLAACGGEATPTEEPAVMAEPTEELIPSVTVSYQDEAAGSVVIDEVVAAEPGWLVIHVTQDGGPGPVIGHAPVQVGINTNVEVEIDLAQATPQLFAMLHLDAGSGGEYEFPGDDAPVKVDDSIVNVPFFATLPDYQPSVTASDQESTGTVVIDQVKAAGPAWIVIHADNDGAPGAVIGFSPVGVGLNTEVEVELDLEQATPTLYAMLHMDAGYVGDYEFPGPDAPATVGEQIVVVPFNVTHPNADASSNGSADVAVGDSFFSESSLTVPVGTTVVWIKQGSLPHTVTSDDGLFSSGTLSAGETFSFTFDEAGTYAYHCEFHGSTGGSGMSGTIVVTE